jgi:hypothetical protein
MGLAGVRERERVRERYIIEKTVEDREDREEQKERDKKKKIQNEGGR